MLQEHEKVGDKFLFIDALHILTRLGHGWVWHCSVWFDKGCWGRILNKIYKGKAFYKTTHPHIICMAQEKRDVF